MPPLRLRVLLSAEHASENADLAAARSPAGQLSAAQLLYAATKVFVAAHRHAPSPSAHWLASELCCEILTPRHIDAHAGAEEARVIAPVEDVLEPEPADEPVEDDAEPPATVARTAGPGVVDWSMLPFLYAPGKETVANLSAALPVELPPTVSWPQNLPK